VSAFQRTSALLSVVVLLQLATPAAGQVGNIHTTFSGDPTSEVTVSWRTPPFGSTSVEYGLDASLGSTATGTHFLSSGGFQHHVPLTGLDAGTTYYYQVGGIGPVSTFKTAAAGSHHFRFAAIGDVQGAEAISGDWVNASTFLAQQDLTFWMPLGDLVQDGGTQAQYDAFWGGCTALSQSVPIMPIIGNHDRYGYEAGWPQNYLDQLRLPDNGNVDYQGHWYDFEIGDMHFTALNNGPEGGPLTREEASAVEVAWMDQVMGATDKKWKFVSLHTPTFSTGGHGGENLNSTYRPTWESHGATAVFSGHTHSFETTYPIRDGELADSWDEGTFYYNSGGINSNAGVLGDWFSSCWQSEGDTPLVGIVDVSPDEVTVTTYNYMDGSIFHQVTISSDSQLPGDANEDGSVTDADYTIWADNYGAADASWGMGDFNGDGEVTDADYTIWADNYGATGGSVPEPAATALVALGALAGLRRRRRSAGELACVQAEFVRPTSHSEVSR
jgi:purple acid phosphatase-like protein/calcineurin-like phosphoesterase family protein/PEP-CTERM motif-containing protein